jgi:hypothetical protein
MEAAGQGRVSRFDCRARPVGGRRAAQPGKEQADHQNQTPAMQRCHRGLPTARVRIQWCWCAMMIEVWHGCCDTSYTAQLKLPVQLELPVARLEPLEE